MLTTTQELVASAAALADVRDNFVTPNQWMVWATRGNWSLTHFAARHGWTQNAKTLTVTVTGSEAGAFPLSGISPLTIIAVHQVRDSRTRLLDLNNLVDFLRQSPGATLAKGDPTEYRVLRDDDNDRFVLGFYPEPDAGSVFLVTYVPEPPRLTLDAIPATGYANSISHPMGWDEYVSLYMAKRALIKEESDTGAVDAEFSRAQGEIEETVWNRVASESPTVRNVDGNRRGWDSELILPPPARWFWP